MDSTVTTNNTNLITNLDQAELKIRRAGIIRLNSEGHEQVEGEELLQKVCGFNLEPKTVAQAIKRQVAKHEFTEGEDFTTSMLQSSGGRPKTVFYFFVNAANHVLLSAMTQEGKKARQEAIDDKLEQPRSSEEIWQKIDKHFGNPYIKTENRQPELPVDPHIQLEKNIASTPKCCCFAEALGFTGNQKLLSADRLLKSQIGFSPLEAMGQKALSAPVQEMTFTPTQLGQMMAPPTNPREVNKLLESAGLQIKIDNQWIPIDQGKPLCEILDTGKAHNNGTPVKQVKWYQTVLEQLNPTTGDAPEPTNCSLDQEARHTEPMEVGSDTDDAPFRRNQKRKRNRYDLDDYFSLVELSEVIGRSRQHVVEVLEKHRIIKWTGQGNRGKYLLTDRGWQFGLMYDPCEVTFHNRHSKRLTSSNAQPVLGYDILKLF